MRAEERGQTASVMMRSTDTGVRLRGVTLFELLLVLVLLAVVASLSTPLFEGSFASVRLRRGTDQVLAAWSQARTHAIESGQIYQFRFQPEGNQYRVDPWLGGLDPESQEEETLLSDPDRTKEEIEFADWNYAATLPETISFSSAELVTSDGLGQRQLKKLGQESFSEWSAPILFHPDGSTSAASLLLENKKGRYRRATLRALTGMARASDLLTRTEVDRQRSR